MKKNIYLSPFLLIAVMVCFISSGSIAQPAYQQLDINNVNTRLYSQGSMFWDFLDAKYEVPKGSGKHTIYAGGLWIGGIDSMGQLHLAAETYRQAGPDYWSGPLDFTSGTAPNPAQWDFVWKVDKAEIDSFILNWNLASYTIPSSITDWPGNSPAGSGFLNILAPFIDLNGNQTYEPTLGEFPAIKGDRALYFIYNDNYSVHGETGSNAMRIEIHGMAYGFDSPNQPYLNNTIFVDFQIGNHSNIDYDSVYVGLWTDFDIGNAVDDYVGTDVGQSMYYGYNGDSIDDGSMGYGLNPPAQGVTFLNKTLNRSLYYNNMNNIPTGNPNGGVEYYSYLRGVWLDSLPVTYGGDGRNQGNPACQYMFPGVTDTVLFPTYGAWSEKTAGNIPEDRRMIGSIFYPELLSGGYIDMEVAYTFAQAGAGGPDSSVSLLQDYVSQLRTAYNNGTVGINEYVHTGTENTIAVMPNPAIEFADLRFTNPNRDNYTFTLYDITGKKVREKKNITDSKFMILRDNLEPGIYVIRLQSDKHSFTTKIIFN